MWNERKHPSEEYEQRSPSISPTQSDLFAGATATLCDSIAPFSMRNSSEKLSSCGASTTPTRQTEHYESRPLADVVATGDYMARISGLVEGLAAVDDMPNALALLWASIKVLGAERAVFINFERDGSNIMSCHFMLACEPGWCQKYLQGDHIIHDPWLAYAAHHSEPIVASTLKSADANSQAVTALASRHGFASAVLVPAHSGIGHSRVSVLCLGHSNGGYFEKAGFSKFKIGARSLTAELHDWSLARLRRALLTKARLSTSDLELLRHQHQGHSSKRIANELHVSKSSINSRFQRMNSKLGVANRRVAARLAAEYGLLTA